jgi:uncharacterized protein
MYVNHQGVSELHALIRKAEAGNTLAQYELASVLAKGFQGEQYHEDSFYWYMKAALKGHAEAMWNAGLLLIKGVGVERALDAGLHLIHLAATKCCSEAMHFLADAYQRGMYGVPRNRQRGDYWKQQAESTRGVNSGSFPSRVSEP